MSSSTAFILSFVILLAPLAMAADPAPLANLHKAHPRLFIRSEDVAALRQAVQSDPVLKEWHDALRKRAAKMMDEKPIEHVLIGPRLLDKSRRALDRVSTLAGLYLIDGDEQCAKRAVKEMLTAAAFPDWNPSHFLDVAEMTNALGIGYDWLYGYMSEADRKTVREAIVRLGLKAGLEGFQTGAWWTKATHNWSQVCNGGLTAGLLAIADEEPALAADLLARTPVAIKPSMHAYAPDGGFPEGPGYWHYATEYNAFFLAAAESAIGTDFDLKKMPGFAETGFFRIHAAGPIGKSFNYADAGEGTGSAAEMFWLARVFKEPAFAAHEAARVANPGFFHLLYLYQAGGSATVEAGRKRAVPLDAVYRGVNVAFFRSAFSDPKALYVGIKGGDNKYNHSHLDLGSFVLDAQGYRWAVDLGGDDYNLPGYFGGQRWTYYRLRTESHNTLTLDDQNQSPDGKAPIVAYQSTPDRAHVVIDLSNGYRAKATKVMRGLAMLNRSQVLVQDEVEAKEPVAVTWGFLTPAKVAIDGRTATLTQDQETLVATILSPADAKFQIVSANPPPPQKQQPQIQNLAIKLEKTKSAKIVVLLSPGKAQAESVELMSLSEWK